MAAGQGIPDVDVVLKKKPGGKPSSNARSNKEGLFSFESVPFGAYNLTFDAPKLSSAMAGKVEYMVILQQFEVGGADSSTAKTYSESKSNTAKRIAIDKINDGFDLTVGPGPREAGINTSKGDIKKNPAAVDSQARVGVRGVRGKIFLVEIGTTKMVIDEPGVKASSAARGATTTIGTPKKSFATREQKYRLTISFYSIGSGSDGKAIKSFNEYISSYEKVKAIKLAREEVRWGEEGEIDYCLQLTEIAPKEQERVIIEVKSLLKEAKFVRIEENAPCRNKR
jgi:hypothetical protein